MEINILPGTGEEYCKRAKERRHDKRALDVRNARPGLRSNTIVSVEGSAATFLHAGGF